jgi:hypothetical protein
MFLVIRTTAGQATSFAKDAMSECTCADFTMLFNSFTSWIEASHHSIEPPISDATWGAAIVTNKDANQIQTEESRPLVARRVGDDFGRQ